MCPAYKRYFVPNAMVFLTLATARRRPVFGNHDRVLSALITLKYVKALHPFHMKAYVVLPDHWHLLIRTRDGRFDRIVHSFKRNLSLEFRKKGFCGDDIWQKRYYDHVIRDEEDLYNHMDYIHFNPVHHGHAGGPADWRFSSFSYYVKYGWYLPDWGRRIPDNIKNLDLY